MFLTAAETRKAKEKEDKKESDEVFSFLINRRDKQRRKPDDPDYDPRTIYISPEQMRELKPFEKQFWSIKQTNMEVSHLTTAGWPKLIIRLCCSSRRASSSSCMRRMRKLGTRSST
jgi:hypothetical protein